MSQENVETMRRGLEAFDSRDREAWFETFDPDVVVFPAELFPEGGAPVHGREAAWEFYLQVMEPFEDVSFADQVDIRDAGANRVVAHYEGITVRGVGSGVEVNFAFSAVVTFRNGHMICQEWFVDRAEALEAVGLSE